MILISAPNVAAICNSMSKELCICKGTLPPGAKHSVNYCYITGLEWDNKKNTLDTYESIFQQGRLTGLREAREAVKSKVCRCTCDANNRLNDIIRTLTALIEKK